MTVKPPRVAPPADPATVAALDAFIPPRPPRRFTPPPAPAQPAPPPPAQRTLPNVEAADPAALRARLAAQPAANARRPVDAGRILCRLARREGGELRVSLHQFNGSPFVQVGVWQSPALDAWPLRGKVVALRRRELAAVARGILDALDAMDDPPPAAPAAVGGERR